MKFQDKVVIITGAAQGIGEACAKLFLKEGANVVVLDIKEDLLKTVYGNNEHALPLKCDVTSEEDWKNVVDKTMAKWGKIDVLVNNAALFIFKNLDEISLGASTQVGELVDGKVREYDIHPEDFGLRMYASRNFKVSSAEESKEIILDVLGGRASPASDIVALNAGAALYAAGIAPSIAEGLKQAQEALRNGSAKRKLDQFIAFTQQAV